MWSTTTLDRNISSQYFERRLATLFFADLPPLLPIGIANDMLKNIRRPYTLYKKNSLFCNQAFNSGNDQIIRKKYTSNIAGNF